MNRIFITLALLLVSQMTFAQTTDKLIQALNKVEDTEVFEFPSAIIEMMNKDKKGDTKIESQTLISNETHPREFCEQLEVELKKLLDNGFKLNEQASTEETTMKSYILGDDKYVYGMVSCLVGKATVPMVITIKGKIDNNNLKGDLNKQPLIDMEFIKRLEKIMGKML
jgi:hypothetical protein